MYAVTGITGKVGGAVASALLEASLSVRAVVRDDEKGKPWAAKGCRSLSCAPAGSWKTLPRR
jgi:NAD(P)H dehydrogenase (quinone)